MKHAFLRTAFVLLFFSFLLEGCKKYPDGPAFTLRSKEERLGNNWKLDKYYENDVDKTDYFNSTFEQYALTIVKSGTYAFKYVTAGVGYQESGTWRLANDNKNWETLSNISGASLTSYTILRLKEKSFWCSKVDSNGVVLEYHYKPG